MRLTNAWRILALILCVLPGEAAAATFNVFGPEAFVRNNGKPVNVVRSFPADPAATYVLHLDNGGAGQQFKRVTSAVVKLNGAIVLKESDFNQGVATLDRDVTLKPDNKLEVEVRSAPGSGLHLVIQGRNGSVPDTEAPSAAFLTPADASLLLSATPTITAVVSDSGSGVDPASVRLVLDGQDRTGEAEVDLPTLALELSSPLAQGPHSAQLSARDHAGNPASATLHFKVDTERPALAIQEPSKPVLTDVERLSVRVGYGDSTSGIDLGTLRISLDGTELAGCSRDGASATCQTPLLDAGFHALRAEVRDLAGHAASASFTFETVLDQEAPALSITSPDTPLIFGDATPALRVEYADPRSGIALGSLRVLIDGVDVTGSCEIGPSAAACEPPVLGRGTHAVSARVGDQRGNMAEAIFSFALAFPLEIAFTEPQPDFLTGVASVRVAGTVSPGALSVRVNGVEARVNGETFTIDVLGLHDGVNELVAVAEDGSGNVGTATVRVIADTTAPGVSVTFPAEGAVLSTPTVTVTGLVNDLTIGTVSETHATVTVNGIAASVENRSFVAAGVPLQPGANLLTAVAMDRAGNQASAKVYVMFEERIGVPSVRAVSGDGQSAAVSTELPEPLVVEVVDAAGQALPGAQVVFRVVQGNGTLAGGERAAVVQTGPQGRAAIRWTIGSRAGRGVNRVRATVVGVAGEVSFLATALTAAPSAIDVASGDNQRGAVGSEISRPLFAVVTDAGHNPVPGVPVTFRVTRGEGGFAGTAGADSAIVETDESGLASARLILGPEAGLDNNRVEAAFDGLATPPAVFKASGFPIGDPAQTRISGVVLDNQGVAVPGVTMRLRGSVLTTVTDGEGQFRLAGVPVGQVFLIADASTTVRPGHWASLEYEMFALAGVDNTLPRPIYILPLDLPNGVYVDETRGGTVTLPEVPGFALEIAPGTVTFPSGSKSGVVSVTAVHADRIPMPPGAGMQPRLIVTVQPAGALFNPPAKLTLPNVNALAPGTVTELFSFDHDIGEFVAIGTGTVSEDGLVVKSDPGFGILEAGWHCGAPPSGRGAAVTVDVRITTPAPVVVGKEQTFMIEAAGSPSDDVEYSWSIDGPGIATLNPSGSGLCPNSGRCDTVATGAASGKAMATVTLTCTTTGATDQDQIEVIVPEVEIKADYIDQDNPETEIYIPLLFPLVYGGSEPSTSDNLKLRAAVSPAEAEVLRYTWSVTGPGASEYTPPPPSADASEWNVGDIKSQAGELEFKVAVDFKGGGRSEEKRKIEVGIRTDDVILIGWIDSDGVPLGGAAPRVERDLRREGPPVPSALDCNLFIASISHGSTSIEGNNLTLLDREYILNWMFKYAPNPNPFTVIPGGDFREGDRISYDKVSQFADSVTFYKLWNHFQIKFRADGRGFKEAPTILRAEVRIGHTKNPCGSVAGFLGIFPGQAGPANGLHFSDYHHASLINDGSPDAGAVSAFNVLMSKELPQTVPPVFWEDIGSKIEFWFDRGTSPVIVAQPYPTYFEYRNGRLVNQVQQAPVPRANFRQNAYPFGTVLCWHSKVTLDFTPGGRCGDATLPADPTARIPLYVRP
jgi:hypothetical protein